MQKKILLENPTINSTPFPAPSVPSPHGSTPYIRNNEYYSMKKEEKELLKKDLCARIPYGVWCEVKKNMIDTSDIQLGINNIGYLDSWESCKPYLRPMSSMTKEEREEGIELKAKEGMYEN